MTLTIILCFLYLKCSDGSEIFANENSERFIDNVFSRKNRTWDESELDEVNTFLHTMETNICDLYAIHDNDLLNESDDGELSNQIDELLMKNHMLLSKDHRYPTINKQITGFLNVACLCLFKKMDRYDLILNKLRDYELENLIYVNIIYDNVLYHINKGESVFKMNRCFNIIEYYYGLLLFEFIKKCKVNPNHLSTFIKYPGIIRYDLKRFAFRCFNAKDSGEKFLFYDILNNYVNSKQNELYTEAFENHILENFVDLVFEICGIGTGKNDLSPEKYYNYTFVMREPYFNTISDAENKRIIKGLIWANAHQCDEFREIFKHIFSKFGAFRVEDVSTVKLNAEKAIFIHNRLKKDIELKELGYLHPPLRFSEKRHMMITKYVGIIQDANKNLFIHRDDLSNTTENGYNNIPNCNKMQIALEWINYNLLHLEYPSWGEYSHFTEKNKRDVRGKISAILFDEFTVNFKKLARRFAPYAKIYHAKDVQLKNGDKNFDTLFCYVIEHFVPKTRQDEAIKKYRKLIEKKKK